MKKVALAHHWLTSYRGGERVLEQIAAIYPGSDVYTLVHDRSIEVPGLAGHSIVPSRINRMPGALRLYRHLLPAHPAAIRDLRVADDVELLLSSDASMIKGLTYSSNTTHVCYCHSPPRYLWEMGAEYKKTSLAARLALDRFAPRLRRFDYESAQRVDHFIANSHFVADRIKKYYDRDAAVVYPPVAVTDFDPNRQRESFALVISELVAYKRIDIAVEAFNRLGMPLVVIGDGPERQRLESIARPNVRFLGRQPFSTLKENYETASVFVFPGIEDFGITPVEAQAAGCPVVAFRAGGALETVIEDRTGLFFDEQNGDALADAILQFQTLEFDSAVCRSNAEAFSVPRFQENYQASLASVLGRSASPVHRTMEPRRAVR